MFDQLFRHQSHLKMFPKIIFVVFELTNMILNEDYCTLDQDKVMFIQIEREKKNIFSTLSINNDKAKGEKIL